MANIVELNDSNFETEVLQSDKPVLVDFWGPACGPCRMLMPVLEQLASENAEKIKLCKVNVNDNFALASKFQVQFLPTLVFFKGGEVVNSLTGAQPKPLLQEEIDKVVA